MTRLLVIMGSGETAPTMVKPHRAIFEQTGDAPAVLLDTPYGFQLNADDITARSIGYFAASVGRDVDAVPWRVPPPPGIERERALATLREAGWAFAGPGSPTYALRQWAGSPIPQLLEDKLAQGGVVVFASAAALTLGSHTVPVYEIYKAGAPPRWEPGLDLVARATGLPAVVIPHYDNAEGGHHDTRFCYLGEPRLAAMERELPSDAFVLGVDEHTAVRLDLDARTATVIGNGTMTIRRRGQSVVFAAGTVLGFDELANESTKSTMESLAAGTPAIQTSIVDSRADSVPLGVGGEEAPSLRAAAQRRGAEFDEALSRRDVDGCVEAILGLEQSLVDWSADTLTSDEGEVARTTLRGMVVRLGELAAGGARDPRVVIGPYVEMLIDMRLRARESKDYAASDRIRTALAATGVEVRDTPEGAVWELSARRGAGAR